MWDGNWEAEMAESTHSQCNACAGEPAGDGGMEETWWSSGTTWPNRGASRNEILVQERGAVFPNSSSSGGEAKGRDGGFKAVMLEHTKGSKSPSLDDTSGVFKELKTK